MLNKIMMMIAFEYIGRRLRKNTFKEIKILNCIWCNDVKTEIVSVLQMAVVKYVILLS